MTKRKSTARQWAESQQLEAGPSWILDYVQPIDSIAPSTRVVPYARTSWCSDERQEGLAAQHRGLITDLTDSGFEVVDAGTLDDGKSGSSLKRRGLLRAVEVAREHDAIVVASDLSRLLRNPLSNDDFPEREQFEELIKLAGGVRFATVVDPLMPFPETWRLAMMRGRELGGKKKGRPRTVANPRCGEKKPGTKLMRSKAYWFTAVGLSGADLIKATGKPRSTCYRAMEWVRDLACPTFSDGREAHPQKRLDT